MGRHFQKRTQTCVVKYENYNESIPRYYLIFEDGTGITKIDTLPLKTWTDAARCLSQLKKDSFARDDGVGTIVEEDSVRLEIRRAISGKYVPLQVMPRREEILKYVDGPEIVLS